MAHERPTVEERLEAGWRPAQSVPKYWQRGARRTMAGEDLVEDLAGAELEPMTDDEERELIGRRWADDVGDVHVVEPGVPLENVEQVRREAFG